ncbi:UDP-N-acetylmuramoyl-L-alanyl-D-glutamate--2,6-diaminopimelate ligase [Deinococcus ruber]|uniref:UDP-N-acetylmuramyl-tripeptide synthetase n=1 Tax=Deinococcus ruber TaxID=1848197 RepID=A0A918CAN0_9DEIO|nr:UDP-N-acetylmuramoyl-L-alanyl-D-glutamate--2,6-diaminopimelate ligase [Deinococcus ruber]GGR14644.1 UDP-N-acetylmuramyl-tripeptide synthetase [Deinococcus ruber]
MRLSALSHALNLPFPPGPDPEVTGVTHNAAWVLPGSVFVAIRGARFDAHSFLDDAAARGAVAVLGEGLPGETASSLPYLKVPSARAALADVAAILAGHPSQDLKVVGVTGTDGKTTTSWMTVHLLRAAGLSSGLLSTVGYQLPDGELHHFPAHFTTPEAPQVQQNLREQLGAGAQAVVLEASSHALALDRVRAVEWDVAIWTQLSSEHLDFHGTLEQYFADKRKLIERAPFAVLNADDPWTAQLVHLGPHVLYGEAQEADWRASDIREEPDGLRFTLSSPLGHAEAHLPMIGRFNVHNALAAMAAAARLGASLPQLLSGLSSFRGVPGRMELIPGGQGRRVVVDFAHTPPSLEKALSTLRATTPGRLFVVIGSAGGQRDPSKRAPLGEAAARLADHAIFTEEDSRDTPITDILTEMERGAAQTGRSNFESLPDRRDAIRRAVSLALSGDTVLLAGKGPEDTLERLHETVAWNETQEAADALAAHPL